LRLNAENCSRGSVGSMDGICLGESRPHPIMKFGILAPLSSCHSHHYDEFSILGDAMFQAVCINQGGLVGDTARGLRTSRGLDKTK
jgi:hypothetical protein